MHRRFILLTALIGGCAITQPLSPHATLILKSQILPGRITEALNLPYTADSVHHLVLHVYTLDGETEQDTGITRTLTSAQVNEPVVLTNMRVNSKLRLKAYAYASEGESQPISFDTSDSWTDISIGVEDRPVFSAFKVRLLDKPYDGQIVSAMDILARFNVDGSESITIPKLVTTFAGDGTSGYQDGMGTGATFAAPRGLAIDSSKNLYVSQDHCIRKISTAGVVTTFAGNTTSGAADGNGTAASFNSPAGMVFDTSGNLYVADRGNHLIRKITSAGAVSTFAGNSTPGHTDANGGMAAFNHPSELAIDASNSLFVADTDNYCIRKITTTGDVTTFAGSGTPGNSDGTGTDAAFSSVYGLAFDSKGNLYVADSGNALIRKVTSLGVVSTLLGDGVAGFADGRGTAGRVSSPMGLAIDAQQNLYVADYGNNRLRKLTLEGRIVSLAGNGATSFAEGLGTAASLAPRAVVAMPFGALYVADDVHHRILALQ